MPGDSELRARAVLAEMLMRISQGPFAALSVHETATAEEVRAAFLDLTKQFHPARYGRMSPDLQKMATEVFLGIKAAHDQMTKALGSTGRRRQVSAVPANATPTGTERGVAAPRAGTPPIARTPPTRPSTPLITPSTGTPRPSTPVQPASRAPTPPGAPRAPTPVGTSPRASTPVGLPRGQTPAVGVPVQRPSQPLITPHEPRHTPSQGMPASRPGSPPATGRPSTPAQRTPAPEIINPPTIRYSGVQPAQKGASDEDGMLEQAMNLLSSKDYAAARLAFHALAAKVPQSRHYRALLCYARGRETQTTGRADDAAMEFQRALQLDPDLEIAKEALRELGRKSRW
ncbi:MAG TPA: hypothetical protein VFV99_24620 [Kofleriaceae bacterium]|nr:hypothetical protein [Kofleriaceae bacterium]